jgi:integrase
MQTFGRRKIRTIDEDAILTFLEDQVPLHNLTSKGFSNLKTAIRGTFKYARRKKYTDLRIEQILQETDVTEIRFRHQVKEDAEEVYSEDETEVIFDYLEHHLDEINLCILLMFVTGLRVGEAVTLKHEDIHDTFVNVRRTESRYKRKGQWVRELKDFPKTLAGWRSVAVPDAYTWVLDKTRTLHPFDDFVFARSNGMWMSTFTVRTRLAHLNKELGIVAKSPHKIRKTYGSILLDNGIDQKIIMTQMGHADILTTERAYHRNRRTLDKRQKIISTVPEFLNVKKA